MGCPLSQANLPDSLCVPQLLQLIIINFVRRRQKRILQTKNLASHRRAGGERLQRDIYKFIMDIR